jgi:4-hydroxy-4-methyl-2-oxoglutarate aldolase
VQLSAEESSLAFRLSGDVGVGEFQPADTREVQFPRVARRRLEYLGGFGGLTSTASDVLDELGWRLTIPSSIVAPRHAGASNVIGHALTIRYLPERSHLFGSMRATSSSKLAHHVVFRLAKPGDVMVVDAAGCGHVSVMGGLAASGAVRAGLGGAIVDGAVRDLRDILDSKLPVWSRFTTPVTGKGRLEAISINSPIQCGGVQVRAGDLVLADSSGVCFIPNELIEQVLGRVAEVAKEESTERARYASVRLPDTRQPSRRRGYAK